MVQRTAVIGDPNETDLLVYRNYRSIAVDDALTTAVRHSGHSGLCLLPLK